MPRSAITPPTIDPSPILEHFRGSLGTELLTAAVAHLGLFHHLASRGPLSIADLREAMGLAGRPTIVVVTALRAMGLLDEDETGRLTMTPLAREHLVPGGEFEISDYIGLASQASNVLEMVARLRSNQPAGMGEEEEGAAYIFREGMDSAMEQEASARSLTLALAGRAKNVAPTLARVASLRPDGVLLDVGGGTGIYAIACLQTHPHLRAIVWDRQEVLKVANEMAEEYGVADRLELVAGDMLADPVPPGVDTILLSNILHDWDIPECEALVRRLAEALPAGGRILIHDAFLNDAMDGPLAVALYSASLFSLTEGRAYSGNEYRAMLTSAGLEPGEIVPTQVHCGVLTGTKPR